jgi:hypothetical protein
MRNGGALEATALTWLVAVVGLVLIVILGGLQAVAIARPRSDWTVKNVYGGNPNDTDSRAYFAFNQGYAWADAVFWTPLQIAGSVGMLLGQRWGYLIALAASVPFWYTAIPLFIWDRDLSLRQATFTYWVTWGVFPVFGILEGLYCFARLVE